MKIFPTLNILSSRKYSTVVTLSKFKLKKITLFKPSEHTMNYVDVYQVYQVYQVAGTH